MNEIEIKSNGQRESYESSDGVMSIRVPIKITRRGGRKLVKRPSGELIGRPWDQKSTVLQLALARGHRWLRMFESGRVGSLKGIAKLEGIDASYVSRMINLTTLAPEIVEAILDDNVPDHITLFDLAVDPPNLWQDQTVFFEV
ncbi:LacI family transcriptional regulator [Litorivicinus lipolyticus]|uniref:LacI family transcriptional regulator n=1 Tax=Litorivicinus lipolyticus TaxID=418701 RepID=A0A5Q2QEX8_9GAMM|nr:LacI family transcriptional regulator [Litorivicinus lipolyticus]QGG80586.1 LacI family transcriptional regulator [Litorivicinus lipolyticus]